MAKILYLSSQNTVNCYKSFCSVSKFWIANTTFFSSWNICSIIPLIAITYLALVHNYNTIKCICFINLRQRAGMSSRIYIYILCVCVCVCVCEREREREREREMAQNYPRGWVISPRTNPKCKDLITWGQTA